MAYRAPLADIQHALAVVGARQVAALPGCGDASPDLVDSILAEAGKFASEVLAPLNQPGDQQGAQWHPEGVRTAAGWKEAYRQFADNGWGSMSFDPRYGGQGLPVLVSSAVMELWCAANMSFSLCPLLTQGAIGAIYAHASQPLKDTYLEKMISGVWTGTMNLTEPQAGTDLAAIRTQARRNGDHYLLSGQKIYITYGDHDLTENIIHLVLARTPDAPPGVKGISLFVVPTFLVAADGSVGERNDVHCVSLERKLGIHASPTAVMAYGDQGGAVGYLVGEENQGLGYMFTMMNIARHSVGIQGYALADRAYQRARDYARERVQGEPLLAADKGLHTIINHPDIRRILMLMRAQVEAMRMLGLECAAAFDHARHHSDSATRTFFQRRAALLTPLVKGWSTEGGVDICSLGLQVHGGMGFIEETGAAQHWRDVRITTIYEGTTAIQANDLLGRKLLRDRGQGMAELLTAFRDSLAAVPDTLPPSIAAGLTDCIAAVESSTDWVLSQRNPALPAAAAVNYLLLTGIAAGCWMMTRSATYAAGQLAIGAGDAAYWRARCTTAQFFAEQVAPRTTMLQAAIVGGSASAVALAEDQF